MVTLRTLILAIRSVPYRLSFPVLACYIKATINALDGWIGRHNLYSRSFLLALHPRVLLVRLMTTWDGFLYSCGRTLYACVLLILMPFSFIRFIASDAILALSIPASSSSLAIRKNVSVFSAKRPRGTVTYFSFIHFAY